MKYQILQFQTETHLDTLGNFKDKDIEKQYLDGMMYGKVSPDTFLAHHDFVCEIEANDLDEVFEIGNIGPESSIKRIKKMTSISVGNVILDEAGDSWIVKCIGFERLGA